MSATAEAIEGELNEVKYKVSSLVREIMSVMLDDLRRRDIESLQALGGNLNRVMLAYLEIEAAAKAIGTLLRQSS